MQVTNAVPVQRSVYALFVTGDVAEISTSPPAVGAAAYAFWTASAKGHEVFWSAAKTPVAGPAPTLPHAIDPSGAGPALVLAEGVDADGDADADGEVALGLCWPDAVLLVVGRGLVVVWPLLALDAPSSVRKSDHAAKTTASTTAAAAITTSQRPAPPRRSSGSYAVCHSCGPGCPDVYAGVAAEAGIGNAWVCAGGCHAGGCCADGSHAGGTSLDDGPAAKSSSVSEPSGSAGPCDESVACTDSPSGRWAAPQCGQKAAHTATGCSQVGHCTGDQLLVVRGQAKTQSCPRRRPLAIRTLWGP